MAKDKPPEHSLTRADMHRIIVEHHETITRLKARCERLEKALKEIIDKGMFVQMQDTPKAYADCAMACFWHTIAIAEHALSENDETNSAAG